jgi:hypothetical protein
MLDWLWLKLTKIFTSSIQFLNYVEKQHQGTLWKLIGMRYGSLDELTFLICCVDIGVTPNLLIRVEQG